MYLLNNLDKLQLWQGDIELPAAFARKGLGMYAPDYTAASSTDFILNPAKLHVFLKASAKM